MLFFMEQRDPIKLLKDRNSFSDLSNEISKIQQEIDNSVAFAKNSPFPESKTASEHVYA